MEPCPALQPYHIAVYCHQVTPTVPLTIVFFAPATRAENGSALLLGECAHFTEDVLTVHRLYLRLIAFQQDKAHMLS